MTAAWVLNAMGLFLATAGAILMYVYPVGSRSVIVAGGNSTRYLVLSKLAIALLAFGFLFQYLAVIL